MFDTTVTIYNQKDGVWYPHVVQNTQISKDKGYLLRQYGADANERIVVFVHYETREGEKYIGDYHYVEPIAFEGEDPETCITMRGGKNFDVLLLGEYTEQERDSDYTKGFYETMKRQHDGVYAISNVSGAFGTIPHFEITGR